MPELITPADRLYEALPGAVDVIVPELVDERLVKLTGLFLEKERIDRSVVPFGIDGLLVAAADYPFGKKIGSRDMHDGAQTRQIREAAGRHDRKMGWGIFSPRETGNGRLDGTIDRLVPSITDLARSIDPDTAAVLELEVRPWGADRGFVLARQSVIEFGETLNNLPSPETLALNSIEMFVRYKRELKKFES